MPGNFKYDRITGCYKGNFKAYLINQANIWMEMLQSRNLTSHSYNEDTADEIVAAIFHNYFEQFTALKFESFIYNAQDL